MHPYIYRNSPECDLEVGNGQGIWLRRCPWPTITHTSFCCITYDKLVHFRRKSHSQRLEPRGILWLRSCCHDRRQHHPGLWSRHCKRAGDRHYICSGFNRFYKVEGNTNGIFKIPPPLLVDNQFQTSKPSVKSTQHVLDIQDLNPVLHFLNCLYICSRRTCLVAESSRQVPTFRAVLRC